MPVHSEIVERDDGSGFLADLKRWTVERTFGRPGGWRRLSRDCKRHTGSGETMLRVALLQIVLSSLDGFKEDPSTPLLQLSLRAGFLSFVPIWVVRARILTLGKTSLSYAVFCHPPFFGSFCSVVCWLHDD